MALSRGIGSDEERRAWQAPLRDPGNFVEVQVAAFHQVAHTGGVALAGKVHAAARTGHLIQFVVLSDLDGLLPRGVQLVSARGLGFGELIGAIG